jgi:WD40 repeat protein
MSRSFILLYSLAALVGLAGCARLPGDGSLPEATGALLRATITPVESATAQLRPSATVRIRLTPSPVPTATATRQPTPDPTPLPAAISAANAASLRQVSEIDFTPRELVTALAWSPDGETLAVAAGEHVLFYEAEGLQLQTSVEIDALTSGLAFSPDSRWLAAGSHDGKVRIFDLSAGAGNPRLANTLEAHRKGVNCVSFSPDGRELASGGNDAVARIWDVQTGELLGQIIGGTYAVPAIAFSPDGANLAIVNGPLIRLREVESGRISGTLRVETQRAAGQSIEPPIFSLAISPQGNLAAAGDFANRVRLWELPVAANQSENPYILSPPEERAGGPAVLVWALAFDPVGGLLASAGSDGFVRLWDVQNRLQLVALPAHQSAVTSLAFHPDGNALASGGLDAAVRIWQTIP